MKANITLQTDNTVSPDEHFISLGGFEVSFSDGSTQQFDFCESYSEIDEDNPSRVVFELCEEDLDSFPGMKTICTRASEIKSFADFFIYIEDSAANPLNPVKVLSFELVDEHYDKSYEVHSSDYITAVASKGDELATFSFGEAILNALCPTVEHAYEYTRKP